MHQQKEPITGASSTIKTITILNIKQQIINALHFNVIILLRRSHSLTTLLYLPCCLVVVMLWNRWQRLVFLVRIVCSARHCWLFMICCVCGLWSRDFWWLLDELSSTFVVRNVDVTQRRVFWHWTTQTSLHSVVLVSPGYYMQVKIISWLRHTEQNSYSNRAVS